MPSSGVQTCALDRKSTRLNSSHDSISYAVFCLKKHRSERRLRGGVQQRQDPPVQAGPRAAAPSGGRLHAGRDILHPSGRVLPVVFFFFNDTATTEIYTLSLHDALPIWEFRRSCTPTRFDAGVRALLA